VYWRVEGSLLNLRVVRPIAFFTWNAQSFLARYVRRGLVLLSAVLRPFLYGADPMTATRLAHTLLRGISRDRLDLLGQEYFDYKLKGRLKPAAVEQLGKLLASGAEVVLVSQALDHVMRPLAQHLGVKWILPNRLDFRDGIATGRLIEPLIPPRGPLAQLVGNDPNGQREMGRLAREVRASAGQLREGVMPVVRAAALPALPLVVFEGKAKAEAFSVRRAFAGKHVMLVGFTGFIGKVWLANTLMDLPETAKIYLLIRQQKSNPAVKRFERVVDESPVFDPLAERYGAEFARYVSEKVEVVEGDISQPGLGLDPEVAARLRAKLDLIINSSGLTDFNPDLRDALAINVDATAQVLDFVRSCVHAGLVHLSTCYVAGQRDGRISEKLLPNYTPVHAAGFDAEREWHSLNLLVKRTEERSESREITERLKRQAQEKEGASKELQGAALENQVRKNRVRWLKNRLTVVGLKRAQRLGWPNTYTLTKSLAESLLAKQGAGLRVAIVRPAIVETSVSHPFQGWNEGINTSASLSYLLGTYFRQLPTNERKRLDIIPVDDVCCGITLIGAAVMENRHDAVYQLATSVTNPCDMRRSIELTGLAHRKHLRAQEGLEHWLRLRFDAIPVSKTRYRRMSAPAQRAMIRTIQRVTAPLPLKKPPFARAERSLQRVEKLIELFEPFILLNEHDFVAENVEKLSRALVPEEQQQFAYNTRKLDWWEYWIDVHIPALRRWTYPLIEGRPLESRPSRNFRLEDAEPVGTESLGGKKPVPRTGATWQYS
jgi:long-chain acyl-CoA synthetase